MLTDKVIIITGGAGLIGQEFAKAVVRHRGICIIADINAEIGIQVKREIQQELNSDLVDFVAVDITSRKSIMTLVDLVHNKYGRIDALVNNAYPRNQNYGRKFFDVEYEDFCENINLNIGGYFLTSQQLAAYFKKQGHGNIVNIASIYGTIAPKFEIYHDTQMTMPVEYAAIKSAIIHMTKYLAKYLKGMHIRVNALSPGGILDHQPESFLEAYRRQCLNKGMLDKSDLCGTLVYLLSDMSAFLNGQNLIVDDGFSL
jgi:NAD(P)-dependent dehydrogenase (short-subunit alcohol dehydrogenase family)